MLVVCGMLEYCAKCLRISPVRELKQSGMGTEEQSREVRIGSVFMTDKGLFKSESPNKQQLELRGIPLKLSDGFCTQEGKLQGNSGRLLYPGDLEGLRQGHHSISGLLVDSGK